MKLKMSVVTCDFPASKSAKSEERNKKFFNGKSFNDMTNFEQNIIHILVDLLNNLVRTESTALLTEEVILSLVTSAKLIK